MILLKVYILTQKLDNEIDKCYNDKTFKKNYNINKKLNNQRYFF